MRELKFRVFASDNLFPKGKMYLPGTMGEVDEKRGFVLNQHGDLIHTRYEGGESRSLNHMTWARIGFNVEEVMQFTGLQDKNGKDIYEGDICKFVILPQSENNKLSALTVIIKEKNAAWGFEHTHFELVHEDDRKWRSFWHSEEEEMWDSNYFEVIGNAFENPELLKEEIEN